MLIEKLILASSSPYRRALLKSTGLRFDTVVSGIDERQFTAATPRATAEQRAQAKATAVGDAHSTALIIGCDQVLDLDGESLNKATNAEQVDAHLRLLRGRSHTLHSAFCLYHRAQRPALLHTAVVSATLHMRALTAAEIAGYVACNEWSAIVGCYRYEDAGVNLFEHIEGSTDTIAGLPLLQLLEALRQLGVNPLCQATPPWTLAHQQS